MPTQQQMKWLGWLLIALGFLGTLGTFVIFPATLGVANDALVFVGAYLVFKPQSRRG